MSSHSGTNGVKAGGTVFAAVRADRMLELEEVGWKLQKPTRENTFSYSSGDRQLMIVMTRQVKKGEVYLVPQLGWAGTLVILGEEQ